MAKKSFSVTNPDAFASAIRNLESSFSESVLRQGAAAGISVFKNEVSIRTPKDTGDLVDGLSVVYDKDASVTGKIATYRIVWIGDTKPKYSTGRKVSRRALAGWLENGAAKRPAQPFVRSSYEAVKAKAARASQEKMKEASSKPK